MRGGPGWLLGFVALVPWLGLLDRCHSAAATLAAAWAMTLALALAGFGWFGFAIGRFTGMGPVAGFVALLLTAPLLQPQLVAFALMRHVLRQRRGAWAGALAGAAAWVGTEWLVLKPLGDTLGHGLYPAPLLRQAAEFGGAAGLTVMLLAANEALHAALARRRQGLRAMAAPLALAVLPPLLLAACGAVALGRLQPGAEPALRLGLVQAAITDLETRRQAQGSYAVVRELLDTHFAMSHDAIERQGADAVLWSETVYPTTFGHPKSEAGAELDREILEIVDAAGVPFVFGTYDLDAAGEYNAAALLEPRRGLVGFYRKTRLFPLTESVPAWLDGPMLRGLLPWAGRWQPGTGARVLPLRLRDGRELPVQPLICRDDVDPALAIAAARLGARVLLTMSNDSWFGEHPLGAELHLAVAAFRSIETRLPQFRVTTSGYSAVIDASGAVQAGALMNERSLVVGAVPVPVPPRTLMVAWGDWVGPSALVLLAVLLAGVPLARWLAATGAPPAPAARFPLRVALLTPATRVLTGGLRALARIGLAGIGLALLRDDALRTQTLAQMRLVAALVVAPELAALLLLAALSARASVADGALVFTRGRQRLQLPLAELAALQPWRWPWPMEGLTPMLGGPRPWRHGLALRDPLALARAVAEAGGPPLAPSPPWPPQAHARAAVPRGRLGHPLILFGLLPLALAVPAFHLHQHIAYGSAIGEFLSFGLASYLSGFAIWWAAWVIGVLLAAGALRVGVEAAAFTGSAWRPALALPLRRALERGALGLLYLGLPAWLLLRVAGVGG